mmetsp:Transcript_13534/g.51627  ORF Transcript_13534/g.51627 Transcript_13534/m.51627 type:complete len:440 (-) Transcript_13534:408-1727(-)
MPGITVCEVLGEGTYGRVYRARTETGDSVCVKEFKASEADGGMVSVSTIRELQALRELRHPNVVELRDVVFLKPSSVGLVFEHAEADLGQVIYAAPAHNRGLTRRQSLSLLYQLLAALSFCHARGFMHRDIKPQNLLVRADGVLKVADWGLARCTDRGGRAHTAEVVTVWYRAPELLLGSRHYTPAVDLWSAGCVFFEMREGRPMYRGSSDWDQLVRVFRRSGSPDEESWPGVSSLPEWHSSLPRFPRRRPSSAALRIDALEADLLDVSRTPGQRTPTASALRAPWLPRLAATCQRLGRLVVPASHSRRDFLPCTPSLASPRARHWRTHSSTSSSPRRSATTLRMMPWWRQPRLLVTLARRQVAQRPAAAAWRAQTPPPQQPPARGQVQVPLAEAAGCWARPWSRGHWTLGQLRGRARPLSPPTACLQRPVPQRAGIPS